jgi:hypothetical protein
VSYVASLVLLVVWFLLLVPPLSDLVIVVAVVLSVVFLSNFAFWRSLKLLNKSFKLLKCLVVSVVLPFVR